MPTEKRLTQEFIVSQATIRASINTLSPRHFIVCQQCDGNNRSERAFKYAIEYPPGCQMQFSLIGIGK